MEKRYGGWAGDRLDKSSYAVDRLGQRGVVEGQRTRVVKARGGSS